LIKELVKHNTVSKFKQKFVFLIFFFS